MAGSALPNTALWPCWEGELAGLELIGGEVQLGDARGGVRHNAEERHVARARPHAQQHVDGEEDDGGQDKVERGGTRGGPTTKTAVSTACRLPANAEAVQYGPGGQTQSNERLWDGLATAP